jgi:hypothetical protein
MDWTISIGDVLTTTTIIISVLALVISWSKDRYSRRKEQADRVRGTVAIALAKLDRWQALQLSAFQEIQPLFIDTSEMLATEFNIVKTRDFLWRSINAQRTKVAAKILDEQIESAYVGLFSHFPAIRPLFLRTLAELNSTEQAVMGSFLEASQDDVMSFENRGAEYTSAMLGNALRKTGAKYQAELVEKTGTTLEPLREFLLRVVALPDSEILTAGLEMPTQPGAGVSNVR